MPREYSIKVTGTATVEYNTTVYAHDFDDAVEKAREEFDDVDYDLLTIKSGSVEWVGEEDGGL